MDDSRGRGADCATRLRINGLIRWGRAEENKWVSHRGSHRSGSFAMCHRTRSKTRCRSSWRTRKKARSTTTASETASRIKRSLQSSHNCSEKGGKENWPVHYWSLPLDELIVFSLFFSCSSAILFASVFIMCRKRRDPPNGVDVAVVAVAVVVGMGGGIHDYQQSNSPSLPLPPSAGNAQGCS